MQPNQNSDTSQLSLGSKNSEQYSPVQPVPIQNKGISRAKTPLHPGVFKVHGKKLKLDPRSLFIFSNSSRIRLFCLWLMEWSYFDKLVLIIIVCDSVLMAMYDYSDSNEARNALFDKIGTVFSFLYLGELLVKVISIGLVLNKTAYLRDGWNVIDITVVISGIVTVFVKGVNLKSLQMVRVLRPLKTISTMPNMRRLMKTIFYSLPELINVLIFLTFSFCVFSLMALQSYQGVFYSFCRLTEFPVNATYWPKDEERGHRVCSLSKEGFVSCPADQFCGSPFDYGMATEEIETNPVIQFGIHTFDDFLVSLMTVFQMVTKDSWTVVLYNLRDATNPLTSTIYAVLLLLLGSFFLLNVILAVIMEKFAKVQNFEDEVQETDIKYKESESELSIEDLNSQISSVRVEEEKRQEEPVQINNMRQKFLKLTQNINATPIQQETHEISQDLPEALQTDERLQNNERLQTNNNLLESDEEQKQENLSPLRQPNPLQTIPEDHKNISASPATRNVGLFSILRKVQPKPEEVKFSLNRAAKRNTSQTDELEQVFHKDYLKTGRKPSLFKQHNNPVMFNSVLKLGPSKSAQQPEVNTEENLSKAQQQSSQGRESLKRRKEEIEQEVNKLRLEQKKKLLEQRKKRKTLGAFNLMEMQKKLSQDQEDAEMGKTLKLKEQMLNKMHEKDQQKKLKENPVMAMLMYDIKANINEEVVLDNKQKLAQELEFQGMVERASQNKAYQYSFRLIHMKAFVFFVALIVIANTVTLASDHLYIADSAHKNLELCNVFFSLVFLLEMVFKLLGLGLKQYLKDKFNVLDMINVIFSVLDFFYIASFGIKATQNTILTSVFRASRLFRVIKLAKNWRKFENLLVTIGNAIKDISTFSVLLILFIYIYTLVGMNLFAYEIKFDENNKPIDGNSEEGEFPIFTFNSFLESFYSVFVVLANDGWTMIYFDAHRAAGGFLAVLYFFPLIAFGQFLLLNIFLAILISNFDEESYSESLLKQQNKGKYNTMFENIALYSKKAFKNLKDRCITPKVHPEEDNKLKVSENRSLYIFEEDSPTRKYCNGIEKSRPFLILIIIAIIASSISLSLENPLNDPNSELVKNINLAEIVTAIIFIIEAMIKIIAHGFLFNGPKSYLREIQNQIDFLIVTFSIILLSTDIDISFFRVFRLFRVLKPVRLVSRSESLMVSIQSLVTSIPSVFDNQVICFIFFLMFGIIGTNLFKGSFYQCQGQIMDDVEHKWECLNAGGYWKRNFFNFNDTRNSVLFFFAIAATVGWQVLMYRVIDFKQIDYEPVRNHNIPIGLFFIFFMIVASFFLQNLFVGIVISNFNREKEKHGKDFMLTEKQKKKQDSRYMILQAKPKLYNKPNPNSIGSAAFSICQNPLFQNFVIVCIITSTFFIALSNVNQSEGLSNMIIQSQVFFNIIFTIEALIKIVGLGGNYFKSNWNLFDLFVVLGNYFGIVLGAIEGYEEGNHLAIIRTFRVCVVLRLLRRNKSLYQIFQTLIMALPSLFNIGFLLFLFLFIYSVLGVSIFAQVKLNGLLTKQANFQNVFGAMLTLLRISTGENWHLILESLSQQKSIEFDCIENPTYEDYVKNGKETIGCGLVAQAVAFMVSFIFVVSLIFLNLFIAIILQSFEDILQSDHQVFNAQRTEHFRDKWSEIDTKATGYIKKKDFKQLMFSLGEDLGWKDEISEQEQEKFMRNLNLKSFGKKKDMYFFTDVLENLSLLYLIQTEQQRMGGEELTKQQQDQLTQTRKTIKMESRNSNGNSGSNNRVGSSLKKHFSKSLKLKKNKTKKLSTFQKLSQFQSEVPSSTQPLNTDNLLASSLKSKKKKKKSQQQIIKVIYVNKGEKDIEKIIKDSVVNQYKNKGLNKIEETSEKNQDLYVKPDSLRREKKEEIELKLEEKKQQQEQQEMRIEKPYEKTLSVLKRRAQEIEEEEEKELQRQRQELIEEVMQD